MFFSSKKSKMENYMLFTGCKSTKNVDDNILFQTLYFNKLEDVMRFVLDHGLTTSYIFALDCKGYYRYLCDAKFFLKHMKGE